MYLDWSQVLLRFCTLEQTVNKSYMYSNACDCSLQVHVDKGMNDGQKITFRGEGDQEVRQTTFIDPPPFPGQCTV